MSITEVARLAGVTHGTVSRLINGRGRVAPETAQRIRQAMQQLDYQPEPAHRRRGRKPAPAGIRTGSVCLLLVGTSRGFLDRPGVDAAITGIEGMLRQRGLNMMLAYAANLHDLPPAVTGRKADGLLVIGEAHDTLPMEHRSIPTVWVLSSHTRLQNWADHVLPDNQEVGALAANYLADQGHRCVALVNDQPEHPGFQERGQSFAAVAKRRRLEVHLLVAEIDSEDHGDDPWGLGRPGRQAPLVDRLLALSPRPTGLFVPTDEQAFRLYPLLRERRQRPGDDLTIVSCDNQDFWLRQLTPRPASIDLNFGWIGQRAVDQLLLRISHPEQPTGTRILVPPRLVEPK